MTQHDRHVGAVAQRLAASLCLLGAGIFAVVAAGLSRLEHAPASSAYRLPGGAMLDAAALTVLLVCAGAFTLCGLVLLLLTPGRVSMPAPTRTGRSRLILLLGAAALLAALVARRLGF